MTGISGLGWITSSAIASKGNSSNANVNFISTFVSSKLFLRLQTTLSTDKCNIRLDKGEIGFIYVEIISFLGAHLKNMNTYIYIALVVSMRAYVCTCKELVSLYCVDKTEGNSPLNNFGRYLAYPYTRVAMQKYYAAPSAMREDIHILVLVNIDNSICNDV